MNKETVLTVGKIYERVKYRNTKQARIIIGRKNPEKSVNYEALSKFCTLAVKYSILPNFYFDSFYENGRKVIPTKPECAILNKKTNLHWYKNKINDFSAKSLEEKDIITSIKKTSRNIQMFLDDNNINDEEEFHKKFLDINVLDRDFPDWALLLKNGLITPMLLLINNYMLKYSFILEEKGIKLQEYKYLLIKYPDLKELLRIEFDKYF